MSSCRRPRESLLYYLKKHNFTLKKHKAYAGESQAHMKYLIFADVAEEEGISKHSKAL